MPNPLSTAREKPHGETPEIVPAEILEGVPQDNHGSVDDSLAGEILDGYLRRLASQEAICRRTLGSIARHFLKRRHYHSLGFARVGDYTRERLGMSARELQSLARVARRLEELPAVARAFEAGQISWAKVRRVVEVATLESEPYWISLARQSTVRALEAAIRERAERAQAGLPDAIAQAGDEDGRTVAGELKIRFRVLCRHPVRRLWLETVDLARQVAGEEVPLWGAAEAIAAEGLSATNRPLGEGSAGEGGSAGLEADSEGKEELSGEPPDLTEAYPDIDWREVREAAPEAVEECLQGVEAAEGFDLDLRMRSVVRAMQRIDWQMGRLLGMVFGLRLYLPMGFKSVEGYARERLGISTAKARALVALDRKAAEVPALCQAYRQGEISWLRALTLLPVMGESHGEAWMRRAGEVTFRRLLDEVRWAAEMAGDSGVPLPPPPLGAQLDDDHLQTRTFSPIVREETPATHGSMERSGSPPANNPRVRKPPEPPRPMAEITFWGPEPVVFLFRHAVRAFSVPGKPPGVGFERLLLHVKGEWERLPRHRDPVFARDRWRCTVPVCTSRRNLQDHHLRPRSRGGDNSRQNRTAVCAWHHLRGIHQGRVKAWGSAPEGIVWEIGVRSGHPPLIRLVGERYAQLARSHFKTLDVGVTCRG